MHPLLELVAIGADLEGVAAVHAITLDRVRPHCRRPRIAKRQRHSENARMMERVTLNPCRSGPERLAD